MSKQFLVLLAASGEVPPTEAIREHLRKFDTSLTLGIIVGVVPAITKRLEQAAKEADLSYYTYHGRESHGKLWWIKPIYEAFMHRLSQVVVFGNGSLGQFVEAKAKNAGVPLCHVE